MWREYSIQARREELLLSLCLQCGGTHELGHVRATGYVPSRSEIVEKMNNNPGGLLRALFN